MTRVGYSVVLIDITSSGTRQGIGATIPCDRIVSVASIDRVRCGTTLESVVIVATGDNKRSRRNSTRIQVEFAIATYPRPIDSQRSVVLEGRRKSHIVDVISVVGISQENRRPRAISP